MPLSLKAENNVLPQIAELQWRICEKNLNATVEKLALDVKKVKNRDVMLWDTIDGDLLQHDWTIRIRDNKKQFSFSAKKNFYHPVFHAPKGSECELDMKASGEKVGCSIKIKSKVLEVPEQIKSALKQDEDIHEFLDRAQFWGKAHSTNIEFSNGAEIELLAFKSFHRIEFSLRVPTPEHFTAWIIWEDKLKAKGIKLCPNNTQLGSLELLREFTESH